MTSMGLIFRTGTMGVLSQGTLYGHNTVNNIGIIKLT